MVDLDELTGKVFTSDPEPMPDKKKEEITNTKKLVEFAEGRIAKLVISKSDTSKVFALVHVNSHYESIDLSSVRAKYWLKVMHYNETAQIFSDDSYKYALETIYGKAIFDNHTPSEFVYKRIAQTEQEIWYDLCNREGDILKITKDEITPIKLGLDTPIFFRTRRQAEQVTPIMKDGYDALEQLCKVLKVPNEERNLFKIHIISLFLEAYPMPIMAIMGEQGSIKSTITQTIKRIVDPTGERFEDNINKMPEKSDDLNLAIYANYVSAFDNISSISHEVSDDLCRAVTGQLYAKRELYTDTDEVLLAFKRKIIVNGIAPNMDNGDLLERAIVYQVLPIQKHQRITLHEYEQRFNDLLPFIIGQCLLALQKALGLYPEIKSTAKELPRMSDFAVWGESISQGMGNEPGLFYSLYESTLSDSYLDASDSHAVVEYIKHLSEDRKLPLKIKVSEFYNNLKPYAAAQGFDVNSQFSNFPKHHNRLKSYIRRVNPFIRNSGFEVQVYRYKKRDETKLHGNTIVEINSFQKGLDFGSIDPDGGEHGELSQNGMLTTSRHVGEHGEHGEHVFDTYTKEGVDELGGVSGKGYGINAHHPHQAHHRHENGEDCQEGIFTMLTKQYKCLKCPLTTFTATEDKIKEIQKAHKNQHGEDHEFYEVLEP